MRQEILRVASLRYDLAKLRAKGLVAKLPRSRRYQLLPRGYSICLIFLKLFERVYAPLTAGLLSPVRSDRQVEQQKRSQLDRLYQRVVDDIDASRPGRRSQSRMTTASNENKIPTTATITV